MSSATLDRPKVEPETPKEVKAPKLAKALLAHLSDPAPGATSPQRLAVIQDYVNKQPNPDLVTAEHVYGHLKTLAFPRGTLRKVGRWIWGDHFEPDEGLTAHPAEELARLRSEIAQLRKILDEQSSRLLGLEAQVTIKDKLIGELTGQNTVLRQGRTAQELALLGIAT